MPFYSDADLATFGFKSLGRNVRISDKASLYNPSQIELGNDIRIDDFVILSAGEGGIRLHDYIHIGCYSSLIGREQIEIGSFSGTAPRVSIFSSSDDYLGSYLAGPTVPDTFKNTDYRPVMIGRQAIIGTGAVILPGVTIGNGVSVGAFSVVREHVPDSALVHGNPARKIGETGRPNLELEREFLNSVR